MFRSGLILLTLSATQFLFAEPEITKALNDSSQVQEEIKKMDDKQKVNSFWYINLEAMEPSTFSDTNIIPRVGIGRRFISESGSSAIDASINGGYKERESSTLLEDNKKKTNTSKSFYITAPKVSYIRYLSSNPKNAPYAGLGGSWIFMAAEKETEIRLENQEEEEYFVTSSFETVERFNGLAGSAVVGYEMNRNSRIRSFIQLEATQGLLAASKKGDLPKPIIELSLGLGF